MHRLKPKYIRIAGIILLCIIVIAAVVGYIAYSKREGILSKEISKAVAKAKTLQ